MPDQVRIFRYTPLRHFNAWFVTFIIVGLWVALFTSKHFVWFGIITPFAYFFLLNMFQFTDLYQDQIIIRYPLHILKGKRRIVIRPDEVSKSKFFLHTGFRYRCYRFEIYTDSKRPLILDFHFPRIELFVNIIRMLRANKSDFYLGTETKVLKKLKLILDEGEQE
jgi:hypothetical protein